MDAVSPPQRWGTMACWPGMGSTYTTLPLIAVPVVDTTGAGDIFHAGFIYGLLQDWPLERQLDFGCAAAAMNCMAVGARGGIRAVEIIEEFMETGVRHDPAFCVSSSDSPSLGRRALIAHDCNKTPRGLIVPILALFCSCAWMPFPNRAYSAAGGPYSERRGGGRTAANHCRCGHTCRPDISKLSRLQPAGPGTLSVGELRASMDPRRTSNTPGPGDDYRVPKQPAKRP